jgi:MYXO-CTERM domain-containing protein
MKSSILVLIFMCLGCSLGLAQTNGRSLDATNQATRQNNEPAYGHNWGWVGLLGVAGLAGRSRKSEDVRRLEATGVNVKTVKTI